MEANSISNRDAMTRGSVHAMLRGGLLILFWGSLLLLVGPILLLLFALTRRLNVIYAPVRLACRVGLRMTGVRLECRGLENIRPDQHYIFVANHQSWLDIPAMLLCLDRNFAFLAKKELLKVPILNIGLRWTGSVPIDRGDRARAIESTQRAAQRVRAGRSFIVYPEGTRTPDGHMRRFKKGAFYMALESQTPIVPVTIAGSYEIMPKGQIGVWPGTIRVIVHPPLDASTYGLERLDELIESAWHTIHEALLECAPRR